VPPLALRHNMAAAKQFPAIQGERLAPSAIAIVSPGGPGAAL